jgi:O-antigen ligase
MAALSATDIRCMMIVIERQSRRSAGAVFEGLLLLGVYGFALSLLLGRGTYKPSLYVCAAGMAGLCACRRFRVRLDGPVLAMLGFGMVFLVQGWMTAAGPIEGDFHWALLWSMLAAAGVVWLPGRVAAGLSHRTVIAALLVLFVAAQIVAYRFLPAGSIRAGLFSNIHYLALFSVITLPILYFLVMRDRSALRWLFLLVLAGDFWLLMRTHSRPGYLALLAAALVTVPFLSLRVRLGAVAVILLVPAALYCSGLFGFAARIDDLVANFAQEERPVIWRETWVLLKESSWMEWWFGHGLGQFFGDYQGISSFHYKEDYASPHNYFLELLYSHGIAGLVLFVVAWGLFYGKLAAAISASREKGQREYGILLLGITTAQLVLGFLTIPFFSRHNLYPLSLILGAGLRYITDLRRHD